MIKFLKILITQILFFYFENSFFRLVLLSLQLFIYRSSIRGIIKFRRWYSLISAFFLFISSAYSIFIGLISNNLFFGSTLYQPELFSSERLYLAQTIMNLSFNLFFLVHTYLLNNKLRFIKYREYLYNKLTIQSSFFKKYIDKFSNSFLFNVLLLNTILIITIVIIGPTIIEKQYPHQGYYQILSYYNGLPLILIPTLINYIFLKRDLFYLFIISSFGLFICISHFIIYFGSRGFVVGLLGFYSINLFAYIYKQRSKLFFSLKGFIYSTLLSIFLYLKICLIFFFPLVRGNLWVTPIRNNIFAFWGYIYDIPFIRIDNSSFTFFEASKSNFNIFNYDLHLSLNEGLYQVLLVIELLERGFNNGFKTFTNLPMQTLPQIFDGVFYERPISDSQYLAELTLEGIRSGGGFLLQANLFWNNSWFGLIIGMLLFTLLIFWVDNTSIDCRFTHLLIYYIALPMLAAQLYYGFQGILRLIELVLLSSIIFKIFLPKKII